jgi:hypothetical protein
MQTKTSELLPRQTDHERVATSEKGIPELLGKPAHTPRIILPKPMSTFVGEARIKAIQTIVDGFDVVKEGGSRIITVEGPMGFGKTRVVQEVYARLASEYQNNPKYWPQYLTGNNTSSNELGRRLETRGLVSPCASNTTTDAVMRWIWWGLSCRQGESGAQLSAMSSAQNQLLQHVERLSIKPVRRKRDILFGLADVALKGIKASNSPIVEALDAAQGLASLLHEYSSPTAASKQLESKSEAERRVELAKGIAEQLKLISSKSYLNTVPVIIVIDDAHWAGTDELLLLKELLAEDDARILVLATAWPEADQAGYFQYLNEFETNHPERSTRIDLERLAESEIGMLITEAAPKTELQTVQDLSALSGGNPLVLNCILDLPIIKSDVAADGRIDTSPKEFRKMPPALKQYYQGMWRNLGEIERELLAVLAIQGEYFLEDYPSKAGEGLGRYARINGAFQSLSKTKAWITKEGAKLCRFAEGQRLEIAEDNISSVLSEDERQICQKAALDSFQSLCTSPSWQQVESSEKRKILGLYLELLENQSEEERDEESFKNVLEELIQLEREGGDPARAKELETEYALSGQGSTAVNGPGLETQVGEEAQINDAVDGSDVDDVMSYTISPYQSWQERQLPDTREMSISDIEDVIVEIVEAEGPITLGRLYKTMSKNSPCILSQRVKETLNTAVRRATRKKVFVNRVGWGPADTRYIRLSTQPEINLRDNGGRSLEEYPRNELGVIAQQIMLNNKGIDADQQKRLLLKATTGGFLTEKVSKFLDPIFRKRRSQRTT